MYFVVTSSQNQNNRVDTIQMLYLRLIKTPTQMIDMSLMDITLNSLLVMI